MHEATPFVVLQAVPHAPQLAVLVFRFTSQPFATLESQLPNPAVQVMPQLPALQNGVPLLELHVPLHAPQWVVFVWRSTSQPLERLPSQLPKPAEQVMPHRPPEQVAVPFVELHTVPQLPQLPGRLRFVSQPLAALPSQLPHPELQTMPQTPPEQVAVPLVELQTVPQPPQARGLLLVIVSHPLLALPSQLP